MLYKLECEMDYLREYNSAERLSKNTNKKTRSPDTSAKPILSGNKSSSGYDNFRRQHEVTSIQRYSICSGVKGLLECVRAGHYAAR
jgi:hypothetical protein